MMVSATFWSNAGIGCMKSEPSMDRKDHSKAVGTSIGKINSDRTTTTLTKTYLAARNYVEWRKRQYCNCNLNETTYG